MNGDSTRVARIELPDGTPVWARISGAEELSYTDTGFHERVEASVESLHSLITGVARSLSGPLSAVRPDEVSVEFGIELTAKAGKVVGLLADGEAKAALTVTLTWNGGPPEPGVTPAGGGREAGPTGGGTVPGGGTGPSGPAPGAGPAPTAPGAGSGPAVQVPHPRPRLVRAPDAESARGGSVTEARAAGPAPASAPGAPVPGPHPAARPDTAAPAPEPRATSHVTPAPPAPATHPHPAPRTSPPPAPEPSPGPRPEALFGVWGHPG
ncbi:CU044_2847 family protein [Streptomyces griseoluteus]